jgi:hypothetical protein
MPAVRDIAPPAVSVHATRNLFAYFVPPPPPTLRTLPVSTMVVPAQPAVIGPPPFTYRYIGTFGTLENAFAVFARDGEVVNARVGDALDGRFTLRRIGIESVDLAWGGPSDLRVPISAAASPAR